MDLLKVQKRLSQKLDSKNIYYVTPINLDSEKEKFFLHLKENKKYNPKFRYPEFKYNRRKLEENISFLKSYDGKYNDFVKICVNKYELMLNLLSSVGKPAFSKFSIQLYGLPTNKEISIAKDIIKNSSMGKGEEEKYSAKDVNKLFSKSVKDYGWKTRIKKMSAKMMISTTKKTLYIDEASSFSKKEIDRLKYHEILTHIVRNKNNDFLPKEIRNCFNYIETEEGLAVKMEELHGCLSAQLFRKYAARSLAVHLARTQSFYEIFKKIRNFNFSADDAFTIAARVKRGLIDTKQPGGFTKDHVYLSGKLKVDDFLKKGGDINDLFLGRISIEDIPKIKEIL